MTFFLFLSPAGLRILGWVYLSWDISFGHLALPCGMIYSGTDAPLLPLLPGEDVCLLCLSSSTRPRLADMLLRLNYSAGAMWVEMKEKT